MALRRPRGGRSSEIPPLMGKAETSTVPGPALRTGDKKQSSERFRFTNGNRTLISGEVQSLGVLPAHTREAVAHPSVFGADQKFLDHNEQAQAKKHFR